MRFTVAAAILANTVPATLLLRPNGGIVEAREEKRKLWRALLQHAPVSDRPQAAAKQAVAARRRKLGNGGMLKNFASPKIAPSADCDPDVGVLACGFGEYCNSSLESSLGGVCVPFVSQFERGLQANNTSIETATPTETSGAPVSAPTVAATGSPTASPVVTGLPGAPPSNTTSDGPGVYCDPDSPFFGVLECNCQDWVLENRTGALDCKLVPETCFDGCEETCYSIDFSFNTDGSVITYQYCYEFVTPFQQSFCFGYTNDQTCLISLDGTTCSTCYTSYRLNCDSGTCYSESCANFECDNVDLGAGISCYDTVVPPAFYDCFLDLNGLYPSCSLCPDDSIAYPEEYFDLPGYGSFNCSYIADLADYGSLNPQQCTYASALAANVCCEGAASLPVYICNICGEEDQIVTNGDAMIDFPGQASVSCQGFQALAVQGKIDETQCGILQGFVAETCGCMDPDDISPTSSPVADSVPTTPGTETDNTEPGSPTAAGTDTAGANAAPGVVAAVVSAIATIILGFLAN